MIFLDTDFREKRGIALSSLIERDVLDSSGRYMKVRENRELYYGTATALMPLPWKGASNIHLPIIQEKVETLVPIIMAAFWGVEPVVNMQRSAAEYYEEQTDTIEQAMNFFVEKDIPNLYETFESWTRETGLNGMGYVKVYWDKKERHISELRRVKSMFKEGDPTPVGEPAEAARDKTSMELLVEIFGMPSAERGLIDASQVNNGFEDATVVGTEWVVQFTEDHIMYVAHVAFMPSERVDEYSVRVRRKIIDREGVMVDQIEYEDLILPYRTKDIQTADRATHRYWLTIDEVEDKVKKGEWDITPAEMEVLRASGTLEYDNSLTSNHLQQQKDNTMGEQTGMRAEKRMEMPEGFLPYNRNKIMVFEVFLNDGVEEGGDRSEVIYQIPYALRRVVRADYLDELYPHGRRPFVSKKYIPVANRWGALGLGDQLAAINLEINAIFNFVNNNQALVTNPFGFYEPSAFTAGSEILDGISPGQWIPVLNVKGVFIPNFPQLPLTNLEAMTSLLMFGDRLTISPLNAGSTQMKNAPRTARGTMAILGEGHIKTDMLITRLQKTSWYELVEQIFGLYQEMCPDEKWYYVTREDTSKVPMRISREMMRGRYEFSFKGNSVNTNREVLRTLAQMRYNVVMTHPDMQNDPVARRAALRDFLKYWGDGTDIERLMPAAPGTGAATHPPMSQMAENKVMEMGKPIMVLPTDDHASHMAEMDRFERSPVFANMASDFVALFGMHRIQHQDFMRAQIAQQNMPVGAGQANNIPQNDPTGPNGDGAQVPNGGIQ